MAISKEPPNKGLFDLPPEIWSKIRKLAVEHSAPIDVSDIMWSTKKSHRPTKRRYDPAITAVSRAIRAECLAHYHRVNTFYFHTCNVGMPQNWLEDIGKANREVLGTVYLFVDRRVSMSEMQVRPGVVFRLSEVPKSVLDSFHAFIGDEGWFRYCNCLHEVELECEDELVDGSMRAKEHPGRD